MTKHSRGGVGSTAPRTFSDLVHVYGYLYIAKIVALIFVGVCVIFLSQDIESKAINFITFVITIFVDMLILQKKSSFTLLTGMDAVIKTYNTVLATILLLSIVMIVLSVANNYMQFGENIVAMFAYMCSLYSNVINFMVFAIAIISPCLEFIYAIPEED